MTTLATALKTGMVFNSGAVNNFDELVKGNRWEGAKETIPYLGGKGVGLVRLAGFTSSWMGLTTGLFDKAVLQNPELDELRGRLSTCSDEELQSACEALQKEIIGLDYPLYKCFVEQRRHIDPYQEMSRWAVRSSAVDEDGSGSSMAGLHDSFTNVLSGDIVPAVKKVWASAFSHRATAFRRAKNIDPSSPHMAVLVQYMVNAKVSGVCMSEDPMGKLPKDYMIIEAVHGLGESLVSGEVIPELVIGNRAGVIVDRSVSEQKVWINPLTNKLEDLPSKYNKTKLTKYHVSHIAAHLTRLQYFGAKGPLDIEWSSSDDIYGTVILLQVRPLFVAPRAISKEVINVLSTLPKGSLVGTPVNPGVISAKGSYSTQSAPILLAEKTNPDYLPRMLKSKAIITESGGLTCHAAMISRELNIPCIVGVGEGLRTMDGKEITIDGSTGTISLAGGK